MGARIRNRRQQEGVTRALLDAHGCTFAEEAGITLRDKPAPLYQLLVLTLLSSTRISAHVAAASAAELFRSGWRTPQRMRAARWQDVVDALGRGGYRRYDESTATALHESATWVIDTHHGDLRELHPAPGGTSTLRRALTQAPRIGPVGAAIFVREVQAVWPDVAPFFDDRSLTEARRLGLPTEPRNLGSLAPPGQAARLASALVRSSL